MQRQCYIPLGFILQTAALLKIDACPMEGFNIEEFDKILGLDKIKLFFISKCGIGLQIK